jgi:hypothetical protein
MSWLQLTSQICIVFTIFSFDGILICAFPSVSYTFFSCDSPLEVNFMQFALVKSNPFLLFLTFGAEVGRLKLLHFLLFLRFLQLKLFTVFEL